MRFSPFVLLIAALVFGRPAFTHAESCDLMYATRNGVTVPYEVKVSGKSVGRVLPLTKDQYIQMALHNELTPFDFVVIDEFPTELDPFPLAGVLSGTQFPDGCHMEMLADIMKIPLIYVEGGHLNPQWKELSEKEGLHLFDFEKGKDVAGVKLNIPIDEIKEVNKGRVKQIKLEPADRNFRQVLPLAEISLKQTTHFGQKVENMSRATRHLYGHRKAIPDIMGMSEGNFYQYIESTKPLRTLSMEQEIQKIMRGLSASGTPLEKVRTKLAMIQSWFDIHEMPDVLLDGVLESMKSHFGSLDGAFRFRSSNRVEDSIGAGVYESYRLPPASGGDRRKEISAIIRQVWKSLYSYRAYLVRRAFGLNESHTDMGIEIHPSYDDVDFSGVASYTEYYGDQVMKLVTYPAGLSPTSPTAQSARETLHVIQKASGKIFFSVDGTTLIEPANLHSKMMKISSYEALMKVFSRMHMSWLEEGRGRVRLDFEWILSPQGQEKVLQVKPAALSPFDVPSEASGVNANIPPEVAKNFKSRKRSVVLDGKWKGMKLIPFHDGLLRSLNAYGGLRATFFYVEVSGKRILLTGFSHPSDYRELDALMSLQGLNYKILEVGRISVDVDHYGNQFRITKVGMMHSEGLNERSLLGPDASKLNVPIFIEILRSLEIQGVIEYAPDATVNSLLGTSHRFYNYLKNNQHKISEFLP